ncbi:MAG: S-layer family protein [Oscillatoria sp. SIO1A7]|nr:S-layer family protein [Oscillatoria sp. SIO1A7]
MKTKIKNNLKASEIKNQNTYLLYLGMLLTLPALLGRPVTAQIVPDGSWPSTVNVNGNSSVITGGSEVGGNLFHSFEQFSINNGAEAFFNNALSIENIISRVTGGQISNIDGRLRANGSANLFLLNPSGIVFGPNASLDIGGSLVATTADRLNFSDGSFFSATDTQAQPLLTVNVPTGLQWGPSSPGGSIVNQSVAPDASGATVGLSVQPGRTIALMGGEVNLLGGYLTAPEGRVELGGVGENSQVSIATSDRGFAFGYSEASGFEDVELSGGALVTAIGSNGGDIGVRARAFRLLPGSRIYTLNTGDEVGGRIAIDASDSVELVGNGNFATDVVTTIESNFDNPLELPAGLYSVNSGTTVGEGIEINSPRLIARESATVYAVSSGSGRGGNLTVNSPSSVQLSASSLAAITTRNSLGDAGNLTVNTNALLIEELGNIRANTNGAGRGGILTLNASESIELVGTNLLTTFSSDGRLSAINTGLFAATAFGSGDAGEMRIFTKRLTLRNGAGLLVTSIGAGRPGNATINATESVELIGTSPGAFTSPSSILAGAFNPLAAGAGGGNVVLRTQNLTIRDGAEISAISTPPGPGGSIEVVAEQILLDGEGKIQAETSFGEGGDINLQATDVQLRNNSEITVTAGSADFPLSLPPDLAAIVAPLVSGVGDGGNIIISTDNLVALENSDIIANAQEGRGGRVSITARGIFGTQFRPAQTPSSDITATSSLGPQFSGIVEINTPDADPASGLVALAANPIDPSQKIASGCAAGRANAFTITGRGGLPEDPIARLRGRPVWWDGRDLSQVGNLASLPVEKAQAEPKQILQEATGWVVRPDGQVELVAAVPDSSNPWLQAANCL